MWHLRRHHKVLYPEAAGLLKGAVVTVMRVLDWSSCSYWTNGSARTVPCISSFLASRTGPGEKLSKRHYDNNYATPCNLKQPHGMLRKCYPSTDLSNRVKMIHKAAQRNKQPSGCKESSGDRMEGEDVVRSGLDPHVQPSPSAH